MKTTFRIITITILSLSFVTEITADPTSDLLNAAHNGDYLKTETAIKAGADVNAKGNDEYPFLGRTALMIASEKGQLEIIKLLIQNNADINAKDNKDKTVLMYASKTNSSEIIQLLLNSNADLNTFQTTDSEINFKKFMVHLSIVYLLPEKEKKQCLNELLIKMDARKNEYHGFYFTFQWFILKSIGDESNTKKADELFKQTKIISLKDDSIGIHKNLFYLLVKYYFIQNQYEEVKNVSFFLDLFYKEQLAREKELSELVYKALESKKEFTVLQTPKSSNPILTIQNGHSDEIKKIVFSSVSKNFISLSNGEIKYWDIDGNLLWSQSVDGDMIRSISINDTYISILTKNRYLSLLNNQGHNLFQLKKDDDLSEEAGLYCDSSKIFLNDDIGLDISKLSKIGISNPPKKIQITSNNYCYLDFKFAFQPDFLMHSEERKKIDKLDEFEKKYKNRLDYRIKEISTDGKYIVYAGNTNPRNVTNQDFESSILIFNSEKKRFIRNIENHSRPFWNSAFSPDESTIIGVGTNKNISIWNTKTKDFFQSILAHKNPIAFLEVSPDGNSFITSSGFYNTEIKEEKPESLVKVWNFSGKLLHSLDTKSTVDSIDYSPDGKLLAASTWNGNSIVWDKNGKKILNEKDFDKINRKIKFSKNGKYLISMADNTKFAIRDERLNKIKIIEPWNSKYSFYFEFQEKDQLLAFQRERGKVIMIYNQATNETKELEDCYGLFSFSFEKNYFMCSGKNGINLFDSNLKLVSIIGENVAFTDPSRKAFYFFNKDTKVVFSGKDSALYMYEIPSGKLIKKMDGHTNNISRISISKSEKFILTSSIDGTLKVWNAANGDLLITLMAFNDGTSIVYTPDGRFDFSNKKALDYVSFKSPCIQNGFLDLQDLMNDYYVDGLLELVTNNKFKPNKKNNLTKGVETTAVVKALFETQQFVVSEEDNKTLQFQITERGSKFEKAVVYVNGIQVDEKTLVDGENTEGVKLEDDSKEGFFKYRVKFAIPLNFGTNRVEVKAYNSYNIPQSFPAFEIQRKIPDNKELAKPDLYILSVGINDYKTKKLTFSVPDAKAMADALQQGKTGIYHEVFTKLLVDAKKKDIEDALADIEKKARPQDVVLVYFSGHGMNAFTREGKKLFYFVPQDFKWPDDPENENVARNQGIDADYLDETFTKIKSHKLILILDACHSGSVNTALASRGQDKEKATRKAMEKMANGTGRFIFASSSGNEESREHSEVGHGLYTHVFLNALGKSKDKNITDADSINKDGYIYLSEIRSYIEQQFEEQTAKYLKGVIQTPPSMSLGRNGMHERVNDFPLLKK